MPTIACPSADTLHKLLRDELEPDSHRSLQQHLEECSACNQMLQKIEDDLSRHMKGDMTPDLADGNRSTVAYIATTEAEGRPSIRGYEITGVLGEGGMGVVYKATQPSLKRVVALKMIRGVGAGKHERERFRKEAEAIAQLAHPNIVQIHEIGEHDGQPFFSLEYVQGGTLADLIHGEPQDAKQSAKLLETLARAMDHSHQKGIVHRDLKPGNILLDLAPGELPAAIVPKITDFGLAKLFSEDQQQTQTGAIMGTDRKSVV